MDCFQIANTGFGICTSEKTHPLGRYLEIFRVSEYVYNSMREKNEIQISEKAMEIPPAAIRRNGKAIWEKEGNIYVSAPYGHCRNAVCFSLSGWQGERAIIRLNPLVWNEWGFTLNQFLSLIGIHSPLLFRNALTIHASYIAFGNRIDRQAILFSGPSGIGKSTQAQLWETYIGAEIVNGDRAVIKREISPSSEDCSDMSLRWSAHGIPVCGSSNICKNISLPVGMIVVLKQGSENHVEEMTAGEKYRALLLASAFYQWDAYESEEAHRLVLKLIEEVPIVRLVCRPDEGAVHILKEYIEKKCRK